MKENKKGRTSKMKKAVGLLSVLVMCAVGVFSLLACDVFDPPFDENGSIVVVSREPGSGSRYAIMSMLYGSTWEEIDLPEGVNIQNGMTGVFTRVSTEPQAIGYESMGHLTGKTGVKALTYNGEEATPENIKNGKYTLTRPLSIVYRPEKLEGSANRGNLAFYNFLNSTQAQGFIDEFGYVSGIENPVPFVPIQGLSGLTVNIVGSTTVGPLMNRLREEFLKIQTTGVAVIVGSGGSGGGRTAVRNNTADFGMVSAPVSSTHMEEMLQGSATAVNVHTMANDAIVLIVNTKNTITNITTAQLRHVYNAKSGTNFASWAELRNYGG
jgi:phosphate transport system substrate-binding protein